MAGTLLAFSAIGCGGGNSSSGGETTGEEGGSVTVGLLHSLTGAMAISEVSVRDAELLAIEEINANGGVLGKQIEYIEEDGASEPSTFATKAEKLLGEDEVATVFGCWTSSSRKAVKQVFEYYNNLLWYPVQYEGMEDSKNIVYMGAAPNQQIVPAIEYLIEKGYKKFFLLGSDILKGHMVSRNYYQTTETEKNTAFVEAYKKKFGEDRVTSDPAEAAYDAVYMWAAACEKAGSFDVDAVRGVLDGLSIDAPEGTITVNGENQRISKPVRIGEVGDDGLIYEVYATKEAVEQDPYLKTYDWAVEAGVQPIE